MRTMNPGMMRNNGGANPFKNPTAQAKIISVTDKFGAPGIRKQQGSTIVKYDILPLVQGLNPVNTFTFFQDAQVRTFPFTNLTDGKLQVGEAMALERMYFFIVTQLKTTGEILNVQDIDTFTTFGMNLGVFNFLIANSQVIKPTPVTSIDPKFNRYATYVNYNVFHFETDIVIPTLIEFALSLKTPILTIPTSVTQNFFIGCAIEGTGSILAPRSTF